MPTVENRIYILYIYLLGFMIKYAIVYGNSLLRRALSLKTT